MIVERTIPIDIKTNLSHFLSNQKRFQAKILSLGIRYCQIPIRNGAFGCGVILVFFLQATAFIDNSMWHKFLFHYHR